MAGMPERATRIGGILKISSSADAGTEVQLSIPSRLALRVVVLNQSA
jgi:signal transduction histidine kinase